MEFAHELFLYLLALVVPGATHYVDVFNPVLLAQPQLLLQALILTL